MLDLQVKITDCWVLVGSYPLCTQTSVATTRIFEGGVGNPTSNHMTGFCSLLPCVVFAKLILIWAWLHLFSWVVLPFLWILLSLFWLQDCFWTQFLRFVDKICCTLKNIATLWIPFLWVLTPWSHLWIWLHLCGTCSKPMWVKGGGLLLQAAETESEVWDALVAGWWERRVGCFGCRLVGVKGRVLQFQNLFRMMFICCFLVSKI